MSNEAADVVIQALEVKNNTVLVFNTDKPVPVTEVWNIRKAMSERGLNPLILINDLSWGWELEKLPPNQLRMLRDMLNKMELGESHTCTNGKDEEHCRACADETR